MVCFLLILGCGAEQGALQSQPAAPTVELGGDRPQSEITWSTLKGLLPEGEPALPPAVGVRLGQPEAQAREAFAAARHPRLEPPPDAVIDGVAVMAGRLADFPEVGATLFFERGQLTGVDLSLPHDEALFAVHEVWGPPDDKELGAEGVPRPVWRAPGLRAVLIEVPGDAELVILKFTEQE